MAQAAIAPPLSAGLIDAKVGDLNGRPIFAAQWLAPLSGRLRAEAERLPPEQWTVLAQGLIADRLRNELIEELMLVEARQSLDEQQQAGLRRWLDELQAEQVRRAGGSRTAAERALEEANNMTLDEFRRDRERLILVREQVRRQVDDKIQVPWREIQFAYDRNSAVFNPPAVAVLRQIRLPIDDAATRALVSSRLASGEAFATVAELEANETPEPLERELPDDADQEVEYFGVESLNEAAKGLRAGEWAGPIEHRSRVYWIQLEQIRQESVSLYDAQLQLEEDLRAEQRAEEIERYIARRVSRAGLDEFERMVIELTRIATAWYGPAAPAATGAPASSAP